MFIYIREKVCLLECGGGGGRGGGERGIYGDMLQADWNSLTT